MTDQNNVKSSSEDISANIQFDPSVLCKKCVMPEVKPNIFFNADGVCNLCIEHENNREIEEEAKLHESDLLKILKKHQSKGKYDVLGIKNFINKGFP